MRLEDARKRLLTTCLLNADPRRWVVLDAAKPADVDGVVVEHAYARHAARVHRLRVGLGLGLG
eukprot:scaffold41044_cov68-Phaeocystis_antarctica.AAC.6